MNVTVLLRQNEIAYYIISQFSKKQIIAGLDSQDGPNTVLRSNSRTGASDLLQAERKLRHLNNGHDLKERKRVL